MAGVNRAWGVAALALLLAGPTDADADAPVVNALSAAEAKAGWKLLFDGQSTRGWRGYQQKTAPAAWRVKDGALALEKPAGAAGGEDLVTRESYASFELQLEWRISSGGNSGVIYHVQEGEDAPWKTGPEMQVLDNTKHHDGKDPLTAAGSCFALYPAAKDVTKPVGQWNQARLVVAGAHVEHWLNGEKLLSYEAGSRDWNQRVAASKFKEYASFGKAPRGLIDLQDHGDPVAFRNIKLRVIEPAK